MTHCQDEPVPLQPDGINIGKQNSNLHLEIFIDLLCDDSKFEYTQLEEILLSNFYVEDTLPFRYQIHYFPLPFHRNSFLLSLGAMYILDKYGKVAALQYNSLIFTHQDKFSNEQTSKMTGEEVEELLASLMVEFFAENEATPLELHQDVILEKLESKKYINLVEESFEYSANRQVTLVPTFAANGLLMNKPHDWVQFIQQFTVSEEEAPAESTEPENKPEEPLKSDGHARFKNLENNNQTKQN